MHQCWVAPEAALAISPIPPNWSLDQATQWQWRFEHPALLYLQPLAGVVTVWLW